MGNQGKNDSDISKNMDIDDQPDGIHSEPISPVSTETSIGQDAPKVTQQIPDDNQLRDTLCEKGLKTYTRKRLRLQHSTSPKIMSINLGG